MLLILLLCNVLVGSHHILKHDLNDMVFRFDTLLILFVNRWIGISSMQGTLGLNFKTAMIGLFACLFCSNAFSFSSWRISYRCCDPKKVN